MDVDVRIDRFRIAPLLGILAGIWVSSGAQAGIVTFKGKVEFIALDKDNKPKNLPGFNAVMGFQSTTPCLNQGILFAQGMDKKGEYAAQLPCQPQGNQNCIVNVYYKNPDFGVFEAITLTVMECQQGAAKNVKTPIFPNCPCLKEKKIVKIAYLKDSKNDEYTWTCTNERATGDFVWAYKKAGADATRKIGRCVYDNGFNNVDVTVVDPRGTEAQKTNVALHKQECYDGPPVTALRMVEFLFEPKENPQKLYRYVWIRETPQKQWKVKNKRKEIRDAPGSRENGQFFQGTEDLFDPLLEGLYCEEPAELSAEWVQPSVILVAQRIGLSDYTLSWDKGIFQPVYEPGDYVIIKDLEVADVFSTHPLFMLSSLSDGVQLTAISQVTPSTGEILIHYLPPYAYPHQESQYFSVNVAATAYWEAFLAQGDSPAPWFEEDRPDSASAHGAVDLSAGHEAVEGACCILGNCEIWGALGCETRNGSYGGDGTTCPGACLATGACCIGAECGLLSAAACSTFGGAYHGDNTSCEASSCGVHPEAKLNEIRVDQGAADLDEYFELVGVPGASLNGLTYLVIGDGTGGSGVIEVVVSLSGHTIPNDGHFLAAEPTLTLVPLTEVDLVTAANGLEFEDNDNVMHLLVAGFIGAVGDDLDLDDDCELDLLPWYAVEDSVSLVHTATPVPPADECNYGSNLVGTQQAQSPSHVMRCPNADGNMVYGAPGIAGGDDTPGSANVCGACCSQDAICDLTSQSQCDDASGVFLGLAAPCETNSCGPTGACCEIERCCPDLSPVLCGVQGGTYLSDGSMCDGACPPASDGSTNKTRFISFFTVDGTGETALRVRLNSLHHVVPPYTGGSTIPFTNFEGQVLWVGPPAEYVESASSAIPFHTSQLQCTPHYQDWSTVGLLHVTGSAITPSSVYEVESVAASCQGMETSCPTVSSPLSIGTTRWGDVRAPFNPPGPSIQPDISDVSAQVDKFRNAPGAPIKARGILAGEPGNPWGEITPAVLSVDFGFGHISACVDAFRGIPYPFKMGQCNDRVCSNNPNTVCTTNAQCPGGTCSPLAVCTADSDCPGAAGPCNVRCP